MIKPRIGGHPVHIMIVHFPSALYPISVVCSTLFYFTGKEAPGHVAFYTMAVGAATGWLAILFGLWESLFVSLARTKVVIAIFWHASLNGIATILFTIWSLRTWNSYPDITKDSLLLLIFKWAGILLLVAGNYLGGKLLLKYHIGINQKTFNHLD